VFERTSILLGNKGGDSPMSSISIVKNDLGFVSGVLDGVLIVGRLFFVLGSFDVIGLLA
jgi:hypothetical protein